LGMHTAPHHAHRHTLKVPFGLHKQGAATDHVMRLPQQLLPVVADDPAKRARPRDAVVSSRDLTGTTTAHPHLARARFPSTSRERSSPDPYRPLALTTTTSHPTTVPGLGQWCGGERRQQS
jgi:hypothetical protein